MSNEEGIRIDGAIGAYMCDVMAEFTKLENELREMRWRMHRGEPYMMDAQAAIGHTNKIVRALKMVRHCVEAQRKDDKRKSELKVVM